MLSIDRLPLSKRFNHSTRVELIREASRISRRLYKGRYQQVPQLVHMLIFVKYALHIKRLALNIVVLTHDVFRAQGATNIQ